MQDGSTRRLVRSEFASLLDPFLEAHRVVLVATSGPTAGTEYELTKTSVTFGRGAEADVTIGGEETLSAEHAAVEVADGGLRVRDLGSTNGVRVNGAETLAAELKHGDKLCLGDLELQLVVEKRERGPRTWDLSGG